MINTSISKIAYIQFYLYANFTELREINCFLANFLLVIYSRIYTSMVLAQETRREVVSYPKDSCTRHTRV